MSESLKDIEQDNLIRQNAKGIEENSEAIRRQTAALEKIRDHYYPKLTPPKRMFKWLLKFVGAVTIAAGIMETAEWYIDTKKAESMAKESAAVGRRLFLAQNDAAGATRFLEKAVELDHDNIQYHIDLAKVKGFAAIGNLFDLGRPLTDDERQRVDDILADAAYLKEIAPNEAMAHVLSAQAYMLRGEKESALAESDRAVKMDPSLYQVHITACAMRFYAGDMSGARQCLAKAESLDSENILVLCWHALFALMVDHDAKSAIVCADRIIAKAPRLTTAYLVKANALIAGDASMLTAARKTLSHALEISPNNTRAMTLMAKLCLREGHLHSARIWLDNALQTDEKDIKARLARADFLGKSGDWAAAERDLSKAISLAPMRADIYRLRAKARAAQGDSAGSLADDSIAAELK